MTTALQAARERLEQYVRDVELGARYNPDYPGLNPDYLRRLEDEVVIAARRGERPF